MPQALAAHALMNYGHYLTEKTVRSQYVALLSAHMKLNDDWEDRLQSSLFAIATFEAGSENILRAIRLTADYEKSLGRRPKNYKNWLVVQGFLWHSMRPAEKCRPIMKIMETLLKMMQVIADDFPDDISPVQRVAT